ncbi:hypothetical protein [Aliikangiella maris]|uniref:DNA-binding protein n=2 Tax=Aliikangiella maris TaxID=3162458 RepID=A0ABV3MSV5_9GAMM
MSTHGSNHFKASLVDDNLVLKYAHQFVLENYTCDLDEDARRDFSKSEIEALIEGGFPVEHETPSSSQVIDLISKVSAEYATIASTSIDTSEAARHLKVNPSRIRQRISEHSLLAIQGIENTWLLPRFQFDDNGNEIPGMRRVLQSIDKGCHPITINGFLNTPQADLYSELLNKSLTPKEWLQTGHPIEPLIELAKGL